MKEIVVTGEWDGEPIWREKTAEEVVGDNEKRRREIARGYRKLLGIKPAYALDKLMYIGALTEEDIEAGSEGNYYKTRDWGYRNGIGDYSPADEGMDWSDNYRAWS